MGLNEIHTGLIKEWYIQEHCQLELKEMIWNKKGPSESKNFGRKQAKKIQ